MTIFKQAIIELILLTVASVGVALAANSIRERKSIELIKNYFSRQVVPTSPSQPGEVKQPQHGPAAEKPSSVKPSPLPPSPAQPASAKKPGVQDTPSEKHLEHDFQTITINELKEVLDDPGTRQGLNVLVDARDDEHFAEGHLPGAIQCFPYEAKRCLDRVKAAANGAEKVIVYCGGGDCEDSIFMCRELEEAGIPHEAIYLFEGGWKEWSANGMPREGGSE